MIQANFEPPGSDQIDSPSLNTRQIGERGGVIQTMPQCTSA